ncbi:MAG TPA: tripartite tricarboxylate transporter substrate binding protein [Ramlibacter sp.]|nr:tripartite tricarboxylate transporter substrate binding protein [Ramlibacter sp.]
MNLSAQQFASRLGTCLVVATALFSAAASHAQNKVGNYPSREIRIIVPSAAGGGIDIVARQVGEALRARLGQAVVIDNRVGGNTLVGLAAAARANPDGYTLLAAAEQSFTVNPHLYTPQQLPYDANRSFEPVTRMISAVQLLQVNSGLGVNSYADLVKMAKAQPGKLTYASSGTGSAIHLNFEGLKRAAGLDILHVPYKAGAQVITALVAGESNMTVLSYGATEQFIKTDKVRALAVGSANRITELPNVPTFHEVQPNFEFLTSWIGLFAPAGTPKEIVDFLNREIAAVLRTKEVQDKLFKGFVAAPNTSAEFTALIQDEQKRAGAIIRATGIKLD